jgi:GNAT superfamily N-acetyltransferase
MEATNNSHDLSNYHCEDSLRDGRIVLIRSIQSSDKLELLNGFHRLSKQSIHSRFFGGKHDLTVAELKYYTEVDFKTHVAFVAQMKSDKAPLGVGRFFLNDNKEPLTADIAITVDEASHGLGIGTVLFNHLIKAAKQLGIEILSAEILASNTSMIHIIQKLGYPVKRKQTGDYITVGIQIND